MNIKLKKWTMLFIALSFIGFISSCKKDENTIKESKFQATVKSNIDYTKIKKIKKEVTGQKGSNYLLSFKNLAVLKATLNDLSRQVEELDSVFVETYKDLDDEGINQKEEELNFNEEKPLIDFANNLDFNSLYQKIANEEEIWLNNDELDIENDPDNHFIIDEVERAVLNIDNEIMVGDTIYKLTENGVFKITDGKTSHLANLDENNLSENVLFEGNGNENRGDCRSGLHNSWWKRSGSKRIKWVVSHWSHIWSPRRVAAKTKNYKKRSWFGWKKYRTKCWARVHGYVSGPEGDCSTQEMFNSPNGSRAYRSHSKKVIHKINVSRKTKRGWVKGQHYGAGGIYYESTLN